MIAGRNAAALALGRPCEVPPRETATGALLNYITHADADTFQPMHVNFGILPPLEGKAPRSRRLRRLAVSERALKTFVQWMSRESGME